jgi:glycosyltransferase involved in cell wall biosynthesis
MQTISAYILAFNEADKVKAAAASVLWADEIVVVDSHSTDGTAEIATALGARVVQVPFNGFGDLRNHAIAACRCDWIFSLDADERCTAVVRDEILALLAAAPPLDVYRRFGLVSELPPTAALPQRQHAVHARAGA